MKRLFRTSGILLCICVCSLHTMVFADKSRIYGPVTGIDTNGEVEHLHVPRPKLYVSKSEIYHFEILEVFLDGMEGFDHEQLYIKITRNGRVYPSVGMEQNIPFIEKNGVLKAVYLPDWNQTEGHYEIEVYYGDHRLSTDAPFTFSILRRPIPEVETALSIVDLEMNRSIAGGTYVDHEGVRTDYSAILEWASFMNADLLWILAGETTTFHGNKKGGSPWDSGPLENLRLLKNMAPQYNIGIGAYIMSFYVPGPDGIPDRYIPGLGYNAENDTLYRARHISLGCKRRIADMISLAAQFQQDQGIDYIGFDFIRTGRADGYELAQSVIEDTGIATPPGWKNMDATDRIKWFARMIEVQRDRLVIEKWRWWRAHRVAEIIKQIMTEADISKPVWVYTLGWNHGKEHGQDPVMFFDAGVSYDAVMLYEASQSQFERLLKHWNNYISAGQGNILVGSCVDYKLLDSDRLSPPEEFYRRNTEAYNNVVRNGFATGIFFHDIARAFWGRKGGYRFMDYAAAHMSSVYGLKREQGRLELVMDIVITREGENWYEGILQCKNNSARDLEDIRIELISPGIPAEINFHMDRVDGPYIEESVLQSASQHLFLPTLRTFQTVAVPFVVENIRENQSTLLFHVSIESDMQYYVRETISLNPARAWSSSVQISLD